MIQLKKNLMRYNNGLETSHKEYFETEVESIVPYLTEPIEIDPNYTLGDLFVYLEKDEMVMDIIFGSCMGGFKLRPYIEEIKKDCLPESREEMDCIECIWVAEQFDYKVFYEEHKNDKEGIIPGLGRDPLRKPDKYDINDINIYIDVSGTGYDDEGDLLSYAVEFTPLYRLKHLPIKLNTDFTMKDKNKIGNKDKNIVEGRRSFTVLEVLSSILSEISFAGHPEDRDSIMKDQMDIIDDCRNNEDYE